MSGWAEYRHLSAGLDDSEIKRMSQEAETYAEEDRRKRELAEARNRADSLCYETEKLMREHVGKLTDSDRTALQAAIQKVRDAAQGSDAAAIKNATNELEQATHHWSKQMYESATQAAGTGPSGQPSEEDVIDAEFETSGT